MATNTITLMTVEQFHDAIKQQGVDQLDIAFVCPMCGCIQSPRDLIAAGAGDNFDAVGKYVAFSCVGRWTNAGSPRTQQDGKPCNWTLGGLFTLHELEVVTSDGEHHPRFMPATAEQAQDHAKKGGA